MQREFPLERSGTVAGLKDLIASMSNRSAAKKAKCRYIAGQKEKEKQEKAEREDGARRLAEAKEQALIIVTAIKKAAEVIRKEEPLTLRLFNEEVQDALCPGKWEDCFGEALKTAVSNDRLSGFPDQKGQEITESEAVVRAAKSKKDLQFFMGQVESLARKSPHTLIQFKKQQEKNSESIMSSQADYMVCYLRAVLLSYCDKQRLKAIVAD